MKGMHRIARYKPSFHARFLKNRCLNPADDHGDHGVSSTYGPSPRRDAEFWSLRILWFCRVRARVWVIAVSTYLLFRINRIISFILIIRALNLTLDLDFIPLNPSLTPSPYRPFVWRRITWRLLSKLVPTNAHLNPTLKNPFNLSRSPLQCFITLRIGNRGQFLSGDWGKWLRLI